MIVVFINPEDREKLHFVKQEHFKDILDKLGIERKNVKCWCVPFSSLVMLWDNEVKHLIR